MLPLELVRERLQTLSAQRVSAQLTAAGNRQLAINVSERRAGIHVVACSLRRTHLNRRERGFDGDGLQPVIALPR